LITATLLREIQHTGRLVTIEENPRLCGWGAEIVSIARTRSLFAGRTSAADNDPAPAAAVGGQPGRRGIANGGPHRQGIVETFD